MSWFWHRPCFIDRSFPLHVDAVTSLSRRWVEGRGVQYPGQRRVARARSQDSRSSRSTSARKEPGEDGWMRGGKQGMTTFTPPFFLITLFCCLFRKQLLRWFSLQADHFEEEERHPPPPPPPPISDPESLLTAGRALLIYHRRRCSRSITRQLHATKALCPVCEK